jgi:hypothetical protein
MLIHMNSVLEIEMALRQLPPQERWEIARWLLEDLQESNLSHDEAKGSDHNGGQTPPPPNFRKQSSAEHGSGCSRGRTLVKTYADTSNPPCFSASGHNHRAS